MLAVRHRLRRRGEFTAAVRAGRRAGRGSVVVHVRQSPDAVDAPARAGFIVPRSVGNAVTRNLVRRRLRHLMRERLSQLPAGTDVVVRALPHAATRSYAQLGADIDAALAAAARQPDRGPERRPR